MNKSPSIRNIFSENNILLARIISLKNITQEFKTQFFSKEEEILQCGVINYDKNLKPKFHQHFKVNRNIYESILEITNSNMLLHNKLINR